MGPKATPTACIALAAGLGTPRDRPVLKWGGENTVAGLALFPAFPSLLLDTGIRFEGCGQRRGRR